MGLIIFVHVRVVTSTAVDRPLLDSGNGWSISDFAEIENRDYKIYNALNETLLYYFEKNASIYFYDISHGKEIILFDNDDDEDKNNEKTMIKK